MSQIVAYIRVSTKEQGLSGLGVDAQRESIRRFAAERGATIVREFTEVESGRNPDRPKLKAAVSLALRTRATLVVGRLDRLARNVRFFLEVMDSGVSVQFVDFPHVPEGPAGRMILTVLAAAAEYEAALASSRTTAALKAAKRKGVKLGTHRENARRITSDEARKGAIKSVQVRREKAVARNRELIVEAARLKAKGLSLRGIADRLAEDGIVRRDGSPMAPQRISQLLKMAVSVA